MILVPFRVRGLLHVPGKGNGPGFSLSGRSFAPYPEGCLGHGGGLNLRKKSLEMHRKAIFERR